MRYVIALREQAHAGEQRELTLISGILGDQESIDVANRELAKQLKRGEDRAAVLILRVTEEF